MIRERCGLTPIGLQERNKCRTPRSLISQTLHEVEQEKREAASTYGYLYNDRPICYAAKLAA
jgi:hypothetical protein